MGTAAVLLQGNRSIDALLDFGDTPNDTRIRAAEGNAENFYVVIDDRVCEGDNVTV